MKKTILFLCLLLTCVLSFGAANDLTIEQRDAGNTTYVRKFFTTPTDGLPRILHFDTSTLTPSYLKLGTGLSINSGVLSAVIPSQVNSDWNAVSGFGQILNKPTLFSGDYTDLTNKPALFSGSYADLSGKPTIPAAQVSSDWNAVSGVASILNKPTLFSGAYADLSGKPTLFSGSYTDLTNKPTLFSGSYTDLTNKPTIPAAQVNADWNSGSGVSQILNKPTLFSGAYVDLTGKPTLFSGSYTDLTNKPTLFSGTYADLTGKPTIPAAQVNSDWSAVSGVSQILNKPTIPAAQVQSDWNATTGLGVVLNKPTLATVATTGSYTDLSNKPAAYVFNFGTPVIRSSIALATAYQATDVTKAASLMVTLTCPTSLTLSGGTTCTGQVRIGPTSASVASGGSGYAVGPFSNSLTGALVVGVTINAGNYETKTLSLPIGWYFSIIQSSGTGLSVVAVADQTAG